jgi:hexosaminidase
MRGLALGGEGKWAVFLYSDGKIKMQENHSIGCIVLLTFLFILSNPLFTSTVHAMPLIPQPMKMKFSEGTFTLSSATVVLVNQGTGDNGKYLVDLLSSLTGFELKIKQISEQATEANGIALLLTPDKGDLGKEGYALSVTKDRVIISAAMAAGIFYGIQTLRQLLPSEIEKQNVVQEKVVWGIPCVEIEDKPRFGWRGLMIDCSRTFWSKTFIKRKIRLMSLYKLNRLHLHLTDDQGWRLQIRKHPKLTEIGSKFAQKYQEPPVRQGCYTQDDIKEIIAYGARYHVTIVPEIEMPGHSTAALTVYPELSCTGGPFEIFPFFKGPGITKDILCAGNEKTFQFLEDVLGEVVELFPSEFIHIGGDEAPKDRWSQCPKCQARIQQEGLKNERELQSYFVKRIEKFLHAKGKRLIGWGEILEGGLAPRATVMSWRKSESGVAAAKAGHDVVMSLTSHCYFNFPYKRISTMKVYGYNPIPAELTEEQAKHILGIQANFWSNIDREEVGVDKQVFPRLLAIAEVAWSPKDQRDETRFRDRVKIDCSRLKKLGVRYFPDPAIWPPGSEMGAN